LRVDGQTTYPANSVVNEFTGIETVRANNVIGFLATCAFGWENPIDSGPEETIEQVCFYSFLVISKVYPPNIPDFMI
jgi:hypothetical protein